jgi:hypothetical protein
MSESMLAIDLFLSGIGKEQEIEGGVLTAQFWPTDATSSQHTVEEGTSSDAKAALKKREGRRRAGT